MPTASLPGPDLPAAGSPALRALLTGLVDYAGLFPPAALDLGPAVENYGRYRLGPEAWMLGRFILPASRLADLDPLLETVRPSAPWSFSVLGGPSDTVDGWLDSARSALATARTAQERHPDLVRCDRFEIRLPERVTPGRLLPALTTLTDELGTGAEAPRFALEVPVDRAAVEPVAAAVAEANYHAGRPAYALKLRCGGVTADAFPSVAALAGALAAVVAADVPFKATAGLHHPLRHYRDEVGTRMHGFLNVFGGAILARLHGLGADALAEILDDESPDHVTLTDALRWRSLSASAAEVADARSQQALSFGSCSFDEPRDDLRSLGWL